MEKGTQPSTPAPALSSVEPDLAVSSRANEPIIARRLTIIGALVSGLYLVCWSFYAYLNWYTVLKLAPNELGDFLAGCIGPLATLWLVLGFLQQGQELRQNGAALLLQAKELKAAADQQRELVTVTRQQLHAEIEKTTYERREQTAERKRLKRTRLPIFQLEPLSMQKHPNQYGGRYTLKNTGDFCANLKFEVIGQGVGVGSSTKKQLHRDESTDFAFWADFGYPNRVVALNIRFQDSEGFTGVQRIEVSLWDIARNRVPSIDMNSLLIESTDPVWLATSATKEPPSDALAA